MIEIRLDCTEFLDRIKHVEKEAFAAIRSGVMKAGRAARRDALQEFARDANLRDASRARRNVSLVTNPGGGLIARWTVSQRPANLGSTAGATADRPSGLHARTFVESGGGSATLNAHRGFLLNLAGNLIGFNRVASGHRSGYKPVFAESIKSGMGQSDAAPRRSWEKAAADKAVTEVSAALQTVMDGANAPSTVEGD